MSHFSIGTRALTVMFIACGLAEARPLNVRDSSPAAEAIVDGRNAQYVVRFDGWVDHGASQMDITENGKVSSHSFRPGTASPMFWPPRPLHWLRADTSSIGMRNRFLTAISRTGSFLSRSRGDFDRSYGLRPAHRDDCDDRTYGDARSSATQPTLMGNPNADQLCSPAVCGASSPLLPVRRVREQIFEQLTPIRAIVSVNGDDGPCAY